MFVSETFSIMDCIFYDEATSSATKNTNWNPANISVNYSDDGYTILSKTNSANTGNYYANVQITSPVVVEWHNKQALDANDYVLLNLNYIHMGYLNGECDAKFVVEEDKITLLKNDVIQQSKSISDDLSQGATFSFRIHSTSTHNILYNNLKIYPL